MDKTYYKPRFKFDDMEYWGQYEIKFDDIDSAKKYLSDNLQSGFSFEIVEISERVIESGRM